MDIMDKTKICNMALGRIGVAEIESMDEATEQARICRRYYDAVRQTVLRKYPWTFATRQVELALIETKPKNYRFAYRYPEDALVIRKMYNEYFVGLPEHKHYKILSDKEGKVIYTDIWRAWIEYTADIEDVSVFDMEFCDVFAWKLAAEIAFSLTNNLSLTQMSMQAYNSFFLESAGNDAAEENEEDPTLNRLAAARFGGSEGVEFGGMRYVPFKAKLRRR